MTSRRVALITGAGTGLGRATALRLAADGFDVALTGRRHELLDETARACTALGRRAVALSTDIGELTAREELVGACAATFGRLDALVNNAATSVIRPLLDQEVDDWRDIFRTNVESAFFLSQAAIPLLRESPVPRIVNIGSVYGIRALDNHLYGSRAPLDSEGDRGPWRQSAYSASKGAVHQLTRELAAALGPWGITVNTVAPGMFPIDGRPLAPDVHESLARHTPLGRVGRHEEIGAAVSFLVSPDASFVTGAELVVDGGFSLW